MKTTAIGLLVIAAVTAPFVVIGAAFGPDAAVGTFIGGVFVLVILCWATMIGRIVGLPR